MTGRALLLALALAAAAPAQADEPRFKIPEELNEALRQLMEDMRPALDDAMRMLKSFEAIDDPRHYGLPEVLPNGDIIIRRDPDAPPYKAPDRETDDTETDGTIKL